VTTFFFFFLRGEVRHTSIRWGGGAWNERVAGAISAPHPTQEWNLAPAKPPPQASRALQQDAPVTLRFPLSIL
jgi:hypothetical protein